MSRASTIVLYLSVLCVSTFCAEMAQKRRVSNGKIIYRFRAMWYILSFVCAWFVCAFTDVGVDYDSYIRIIKRASFEELFLGEVGLNMLAMIAKTIFAENYAGVMFAMNTLAILIAYYAIYKLRYKASLGLAVFSYFLLSYLRFYLVGMHISTALVLLSIVYMVEGDDGKAILTYFIGCTMHYSAILLLPAVLLFYLVTFRKKKISKLMLVGLFVVYMIVIVSASSLYVYLTSRISLFSHYAEHGLINDYQGTGLMQFIYFVPILYMGLQIYGKHKNKRLINMALILGMTSFLFGMLGYSMNVVARMYEHFIGLYIVIIPMFLFDRKNYQNIRSTRFFVSYRSELIIWVSCVCLRGFDVWFDVLNTASSTDIAKWRFFWPF